MTTMYYNQDLAEERHVEEGKLIIHDTFAIDRLITSTMTARGKYKERCLTTRSQTITQHQQLLIFSSSTTKHHSHKLQPYHQNEVRHHLLCSLRRLRCRFSHQSRHRGPPKSVSSSSSCSQHILLSHITSCSSPQSCSHCPAALTSPTRYHPCPPRQRQHRHRRAGQHPAQRRPYQHPEQLRQLG